MNKKYLILLTLTFSFLLPSCAFAFSDVEGHWAEDVINKASNYNIITGYSDDTFKPDLYMTRAELVTVINRLIGIESETDKYIPDVTSKDWFYNDIRKSVSAGIIQGDGEGYVKPDDYVTREQAILIISRAFNIKSNEVLFSNSNTDIDEISNWAKPEFLTFIRKQYITGYSDNTYKPKNNISRAEILTLLDRVIKNIQESLYSAKLNGNTLIRNRNVTLNNVEIFGDLIIGETAAKTINLNNVIINGNLILYAPIDLQSNVIAVNGDTINIYENMVKSDLYYINNEYGLTFPLPDGASAFTIAPYDKKDYDKKDLIIVNAEKNYNYYFEKINDISKKKIKDLRSDSIYKKVNTGIINGYPYELYTDNTLSQFLVIKRDNIVYTLLFLNIVSDNVIDNVLSNIDFISGTEVVNHESKIYKNSKLCLKFSYKEGYVGIDDSYNTGIIYSGDSMFKLFIQVNMITDIEDYSIKEVTYLLKTLIKSDGNIVKEEVKKINSHDAIQFEIESDDDKTISLYVIIGNNLYNFIYKGNTYQMNTIGKDLFNEIVNSMEF